MEVEVTLDADPGPRSKRLDREIIERCRHATLRKSKAKLFARNGHLFKELRLVFRHFLERVLLAEDLASAAFKNEDARQGFAFLQDVLTYWIYFLGKAPSHSRQYVFRKEHLRDLTAN